MYTFLTFFLMFKLGKTNSLTEIQGTPNNPLTPNSPLYDLIFSEKFPPVMPTIDRGRTSLKQSDRDKLKYNIIDEKVNEVDSDVPIFVPFGSNQPTSNFRKTEEGESAAPIFVPFKSNQPNSNLITDDNNLFRRKTGHDQKDESTIQKMIHVGRNLRLAMIDCKILLFILFLKTKVCQIPLAIVNNLNFHTFSIFYHLTFLQFLT